MKQSKISESARVSGEGRGGGGDRPDRGTVAIQHLPGLHTEHQRGSTNAMPFGDVLWTPRRGTPFCDWNKTLDPLYNAGSTSGCAPKPQNGDMRLGECVTRLKEHNNRLPRGMMTRSPPRAHTGSLQCALQRATDAPRPGPWMVMLSRALSDTSVLV